MRRATAGRLAKADLATEMVRELTELQGVMGGIYAREEGQPERVWKAIYYHYLPDCGRRRRAADAAAAGRCGGHMGGGVAGGQARHGRRHVLRRREADRVARSVRLAAPGPRHFQDPRRSAGADRARPCGRRSTPLLSEAAEPFAPFDEWPPDARQAMDAFLLDRYRYVLEQRGFDVRNVRAVLQARDTRS